MDGRMGSGRGRDQSSRWHQFHGNESWGRDGEDGLGVVCVISTIDSRVRVCFGVSLSASAVGPPGNARGSARRKDGARAIKKPWLPLASRPP